MAAYRNTRAGQCLGRRMPHLLDRLPCELRHDAVQVGLVVHDLLRLNLDIHRLRPTATV